MEGNYTFETVGENKLIISDNPDSPVKNQLNIKVTYDGDEAPEITTIIFSFPQGGKDTDFATESEMGLIDFKVDDWTVSAEAFRKLKNKNARWYGEKYEADGKFNYRVSPVEGWGMQDHVILELTMENIVTTASEGNCVISCIVKENWEPPMEHELEIIKERRDSVRILDFYPDSGSALEGKEVKLNWVVENAKQLVLYSGAEEQGRELELSRNSVGVEVNKSTEYRLEAVNGKKKDSRKTMIQVMPLFLKQFDIDYDNQKLRWDIHCGKNIKINGVPTKNEMSETELQDYAEGHPIVLIAEGKNTSVESVVYYRTKKESTDVQHFQKTITFYKDFQILDVSWECPVLQERDTPSSIRIVYQDRERNELYDIKGEKTQELKGHWQQILTGTDPQRAGENVLVSMYVKLFGGEEYVITI